jgi:phosphatidylinositol-3-phosphatase
MERSPQMNHSRQSSSHRRLVAGRLLTLLLVGLLGGFPSKPGFAALPPVQTVFVIVLENGDWEDVLGSSSMPYLNRTLLPLSSFCSQYYNPPNLHPSEPNYIWLEAGTNFNVNSDDDPAVTHQHTTNHLTTLLNTAGITWKTYQEDIDGTQIPLTSTNFFTPRHCPFLYFDDVTGTNDPNYAYGLSHIRPYIELAGDLTSNNIARYNFITPNVCDDGHDPCPPITNRFLQADNWLSTEIPRLTNSPAFQNDGAIFIVWDEGEDGDGPIGMIVLSPLAKGGGYANSIHYTHSSTLRTMQEIFNVSPFLADAAVATDLSDLFVSPGFRLRIFSPQNNTVPFTVTGATPGQSHILQTSADLSHWSNLITNTPTATSFSGTVNFTNTSISRFFRELRQP